MFFICGAIVGDFFTRKIHESAAFLVVGLLLAVNIMMFFNHKSSERRRDEAREN